RVGNCSRFVYACRSLARAVMKGPTPEVIWVFSSAQNAGFHLVTRSHHASIHTLDEVCCLQRSSKNMLSMAGGAVAPWAGIPSGAASPPRRYAPSHSPAPRRRPAAADDDAARSPTDRLWSPSIAAD